MQKYINFNGEAHETPLATNLSDAFLLIKIFVLFSMKIIKYPAVIFNQF